MALKKDKQKVLGEVFDTERVKSFLNVPKREGVEHDYDILEKAYRGMKAENFGEFVAFFNDAGHNINVVNENGHTFLHVIKEHNLSSPYIDIVKSAGASD